MWNRKKINTICVFELKITFWITVNVYAKFKCYGQNIIKYRYDYEKNKINFHLISISLNCIYKNFISYKYTWPNNLVVPFFVA